MISKTDAQIRSEIITSILNRLPNLDLTEGTSERDLFVEAPLSGALSELWEGVVYAQKLFAPLKYYADLADDDIQAYTANYNVIPRGPTYSAGNIVLYRNTAPTSDITITDGYQVSTEGGNSVVFVIQGTYVMYASIAASYYNATTGRWEITCSVKALNPGPAYRAGTGAVTRIVNTINGIDGCINTAPITGGLSAESVQDALSRTVDAFQGRGLSATQGVQNFVSSYVDAVNLVGANDPEMIRDDGIGGALDIYVIGETLTTALDTATITSTGLANPLDVYYTNNSVTFQNQPVRQIVSVAVNGSILVPSRYTFVPDTGILSKSTRALDKVMLTSTGTFSIGDVVEVTYIYNSLLITVEDSLNSTSNHFQNRDYLLREMTEVTVDVYMRFKEVSGQSWDYVHDLAETEVSSLINTVLTAGSLEKADVVGVVKNIKTVDNIDLASVVLTPTGGGTLTAQGDILFSKNEYPTAGTITLVRWTN